MAGFARVVALAAIISLFVVDSGMAQSFNCQTAYRPDEVEICDRSNRLFGLDRQLQKNYTDTLAKAPQHLQRMIRDEHEAWLASRHRCRADVQCIRDHYLARLREVDVVLKKKPANPPPPSARPGCTVFRDHNYGGNSSNIKPNTDLAFLGGGWNNTISSVQLSAGCRFIAYKSSFFRGTSKTFRASTPRMGQAWNDRISSIECSC